MTISEKQLRELVIEPILKEVNLYSKAAENLLILTYACEGIINNVSHIKQTEGPALGVIQMEPATHKWMRDYISARSSRLKKVVEWIINTGGYHEERLVYDLKYAFLMCRMRYLVVPEGLPKADDIKALAAYWKKYYNTIHGKGTVSGAIIKYNSYVR